MSDRVRDVLRGMQYISGDDNVEGLTSRRVDGLFEIEYGEFGLREALSKLRLSLAHQCCGHVCKEIAELKARVGEGLHNGNGGAAGTRPNLGDRQRLLVPRHLDDGGDYKAVAVIGNWVALVERRHKLARSAREQKLQRRYLAGKHPAVGFEAAAGDRHEGREPRRGCHQAVLGACEVL